MSSNVALLALRPFIAGEQRLSSNTE